MSQKIETSSPANKLETVFTCNKCGARLSYETYMQQCHGSVMNVTHKVEPCSNCIRIATAPVKRFKDALEGLGLATKEKS